MSTFIDFFKHREFATQQSLEDTLSNEVNIPVQLVLLASLRHWDVLRDGNTLTEQQLAERVEDVKRVIKASSSAIRNKYTIYSEDRRKSALLDNSTELRIEIERRKEERRAHNLNVEEKLIEIAQSHKCLLLRADSVTKHRYGYGIPSAIGGFKDGYVVTHAIGRNKGSTLFLNIFNEPQQHYWARMTGLPISKIRHYPKDIGIHIMDLVYFASQIRTEIALCPDKSPGYYQRAGAFMNARDMANKGNAKPIVLAAHLNAKYMDLLNAHEPEDFFAPLINCIEQRVSVPHFVQVTRAVNELRLRLAMHLTDHPDKNKLSPPELGEKLRREFLAPITGSKEPITLIPIYNSYFSTIKPIMKTDPERLFYTINEMLEKKRLLSNGSQYIGHGIIKAACFFNRDLVLPTNTTKLHEANIG